MHYMDQLQSSAFISVKINSKDLVLLLLLVYCSMNFMDYIAMLCSLLLGLLSYFYTMVKEEQIILINIYFTFSTHYTYYFQLLFIGYYDLVIGQKKRSCKKTSLKRVFYSFFFLSKIIFNFFNPLFSFVLSYFFHLIDGLKYFDVVY